MSGPSHKSEGVHITHQGLKILAEALQHDGGDVKAKHAFQFGYQTIIAQIQKELDNTNSIED